MLGQGLASVVDTGTTLRQRWSNLLCLPDMRCTGPVLVLCFVMITVLNSFINEKLFCLLGKIFGIYILAYHNLEKFTKKLIFSYSSVEIEMNHFLGFKCWILTWTWCKNNSP